MLDLGPDAPSDSERLPFSGHFRIHALLPANVPRFPLGKLGFALLLSNFGHDA